MRKRFAGAFVAVVATALIAASTALSDPVTSVALGTIGFGAIAVDDANGHVFVSGPLANEVLVFDFNGNLVTTIPNLYGASALLVHGTSLYVSEANAGAIERIDLATLTDAGPVATGLNLPSWLAFAGGKLWTAVNGQFGWADLASVGLDGTVTVFTNGGNYYEPDFGTSPADPNTLYVVNDGQSPGWIFRLDVSSGVPAVTASNTYMDQQNNEQVVVSPDGTRVIPAAGAPYLFEELSASTLQPDGLRYPAQAYPSAVAVSPGSGGLLATGLSNNYSTNDISVFRLGLPQAIFTATTLNASGTTNVVSHGLALSADGSRLFAVTWDNGYGADRQYRLSTFAISTPGAATTTSLALTPNPAGFGQPVTATATVSAGDGGGSVAFYANQKPVTGCGAQPLTQMSNGWTATCTMPSLPLGQTVLEAVYSGDLQSFSSFAQTTETVGKAATTTTASPAQVSKGKAGAYVVTYSATLTAYGAPMAGRTLSFSAGGTEICTSVTDASGTANCEIGIKNNTALKALQKSGYTASFAGDSQYLPSSGSAPVGG